mmetsp:Transcript_9211/g.27667  ORF Transcript_9211/g.27667 Transcript_9211/m.27667 type:complete len:215 (+) Transcript_9211:392-1036(+)
MIQVSRPKTTSGWIRTRAPSDRASSLHYMGAEVPARQRATMPARLGFSRAAATRSLSFSCLFTAASLACPPGLTAMSTLKRGGRARSSFTRMHSPIRVAMLQCCTVGVNWTCTAPASSCTDMSDSETTLSCSRLYGCSGSWISRMCSKISSASMGSRSPSSPAASRSGLTGVARRSNTTGFGFMSVAMSRLSSKTRTLQNRGKGSHQPHISEKA